MNRSTNRRLLAGLTILLTGGIAASLWTLVHKSAIDRAAGPIRVTPVDDGYVGSRACADCHDEIWKKYAGHPMAQSLASIGSASPIENYADQTTFLYPESRQYHVERTSDQVVHHERMIDRHGEVLYDQAVEVHYAVGSGQRGRSYLFDREGLLYVSPIAWYSTAGRWDPAPGYEPLTHPRFERRANDHCLSCHAGRLAHDRRWPDRYGEPPFVEEAIGCERCHGPGAGHIGFHSGGDKSPSADGIVNPAKLEAANREDVCNQCHLSGDLRILRPGRSTHDFRPGQRLEDTWVVFVRGPQATTGGTTRAVNQVQQMRSSICYQASAGRLGCISCHDPHSVPGEAVRAEFYNARCLNCHRDKGCSLQETERTAPTASGSCIACHMPRLAASNVPHTAQTDHRIPRRGDAPAARERREWQFFDGSEARLPPAEVERAQALLQLWHPDHRLSQSEYASLASKLSSITQADPGDVSAWIELGNIHFLHNRLAEAESCWRQALQGQPLEERALKSLAVLESRQGNLAGAIAAARQLLRADPWQAESHTLLAQFLDDAGEVDEAVAEIERGLEINPTQLSVREWLALAYRKMGRPNDAGREERLIEGMRNR